MRSEMFRDIPFSPALLPIIYLMFIIIMIKTNYFFIFI